MKKMFTRIAVVFSLLFFCAVASNAQWNSDTAINTIVCNNSSIQTNVQMCSDGKGGAIMVWEDKREGINKIFAQRIDSIGTSKWAANGIKVSTSDSLQTAPKIVSDKAGGAYIVWVENGAGKTTDIYGAHIDSMGNELWVGGRAICTATGNQNEPSIACLGAGTSSSAAIVWTDFRNSTTNSSDIYIQSVSFNGTLGVAQDGKLVTSTSGIQTKEQSSPKIMAHELNGLWVVYRNNSGGLAGYDIYATHFSVLLSQTYDINMSQQQGSEGNQKLATDGAGGLIVVWDLGTSTASGYNIYAQYVDWNGTRKWAAGGITVCNANATQSFPEIVGDGKGNTIMSWVDARQGQYVYVYAQRFDKYGNAKWTANGILVGSTAVNTQEQISLVDNKKSGAVLVFKDSRYALSNGGYPDVFAQQLDSLGTKLWGNSGKAVSTAANFQEHSAIIPANNDSYIICWNDSRTGTGDIYASKIESNGVLPTNITSIILTNKSNTNILSWISENEINVSHFNIQYSTNGKEFTTVGLISAGKNQYSFNHTNYSLQNTNYYRLQIVDKDGSATYSKIVSVSSIKFKEQISLYPTVVNSTTTLKINVDKNEIYTVNILDVNGKIITQKSYNIQQGINTVTIDCSVLQPKMYFISVMNKNETVTTQKIIKQ